VNEQTFKKHLRDLAHGHHHPEEHDWKETPGREKKAPARKEPAKAKRSRRK